MKTTYTLPAYLILAIFGLVSSSFQAQNPLTQDSLQVEWEQLDGPPGFFYKVAADSGFHIAHTATELYLSTNDGIDWEKNKAFGHRRIYAVGAFHDTLYVLATTDLVSKQAFIYYSVNQGITWVKSMKSWDVGTIDDHLTKIKNFQFFSDTKNMFFRSYDIWHYLKPDGSDWNSTLTALGAGIVSNVTFVDGVVSGIFKSNTQEFCFYGTSLFDNQLQLVPLPNETAGNSTEIKATAFYQGKFHILTSDKKYFVTANNGTGGWIKTVLAIPLSNHILQAEYLNGGFIIKTINNLWKLNLLHLADFQSIHKQQFIPSIIFEFSITAAGIWHTSSQYHQLLSPDFGQSWVERAKGVTGFVTSTQLKAFCGKLNTSAYQSNQQDGNWNTADSRLHNFGRIIGEANGVAYSFQPLMRSTDCGETWDSITAPNIYLQVQPKEIVQVGNRLLMWNTLAAPFLFSDDNGVNWIEMSEPVPYFDCRSVVVHGDTIMALSKHGVNRLYRTTDWGQNWELLPNNSPFTCIRRSPSGTIIGTTLTNSDSYHIHQSKDFGDTWTTVLTTTERYGLSKIDYEIFYPSGFIQLPLVQNGNMILHAKKGVYISIDDGLNWTRLTNLPFYNITRLLFNDNFELVEGGIYYLLDEGYLYAFTEYQGIWRTEFTPVVAHIKVHNSEFGIVSGRVYKDYDGDCTFNPAAGDQPLSNKPVSISYSNTMAVTDGNGVYRMALPVGNHIIQTMPPAYFKAGCTSDSVGVVVVGNQTTTHDFAFSAIPDQKDLCLLITTPFAARPGFEAVYKLQVVNAGTTPISGAIATFSFNANWMIPLSISPIGSYTGAQAVINLPDMAPGEVVIIALAFTLNPATPLGTSLLFSAEAPVIHDVLPENNLVRNTQIVQGSYDPNDKNAQPIVPQPPGQARLLDYLIRFQNTGTDTAFTVVVTDTIEPALNLMSLKNLDASHTFECSILPGRVVKWKFKNILLPDSNTNEAASHGYLRFQIETIGAIPPDGDIKNDADIFFDFNKPVRTNEATSTNEKWKVVRAQSIELCTGEMWNDSIWTQSTSYLVTNGDAWIDTLTILSISVNPVWNLQFDTNHVIGVPFLGIPVFSDTTITQHLLTTDGCDSIVHWNVSVKSSATHASAAIENSIQITPNPSSGQTCITVNASNSNKLLVKVHAATGALLQTITGNINQQKQQMCLDLAPFANGIYFITVQSDTGQSIHRFVKSGT